MFERFTVKAIKTIMLAQEEARRLGHNYVGSEQILLGLIGEGTGRAAKALKLTGITLSAARASTEKIIGRGDGRVAIEIPFTARAKQILESSWQEARELGVTYIGTEHLLLGLIKVGSNGDGIAAQVLQDLHVDTTELRRKILRILHNEHSIKTVGLLAITDAAKLQASRVGEISIRPEHLLLTLAAMEFELETKYFSRFGVTHLELCGIFDEMRRQRGKTKTPFALALGQRIQAALPITWFEKDTHELLRVARAKCSGRADPRVDTDHVLFAILSTPDEFVMGMLSRAGVDADSMLQMVEDRFAERDKIIDEGTSGSRPTAE